MKKEIDVLRKDRKAVHNELHGLVTYLVKHERDNMKIETIKILQELCERMDERQQIFKKELGSIEI